MPEQQFNSKMTPTSKQSTGLLKTYEESSIPVSTPDKCPPKETSNSCKDGSSHNDIDCPFATVEMQVTGNEPTRSSYYLRYCVMIFVYKICRSILKAALSAITIWQNTMKEKEEEGEEEEKNEDMVEEEEEWYEAKEEEEMEEEEEEEYEEIYGEEDEDQYAENFCIICEIFHFMNMFVNTETTIQWEK